MRFSKAFRYLQLSMPLFLLLTLASLVIGVLPAAIGMPVAKVSAGTVACADGSIPPGGDVSKCPAPLTNEDCQAERNKKFLGIFPVWYEYVQDYGLETSPNTQDSTVTQSQFGIASCGIVHPNGSDAATNIKKDAIAIALAVLDILLRVGALVGVVFIMMGGYKYISSQGEPKNIEAAMATIVNAVIGLVIVILAAALVAFVGHTLRG